ncbi:MAG: glycosyl hydrolase family 28-related protein [Bryobacteraceae bacterium]|nr:glycosyl hydrolase family 28-related protein [Bryobacteraceae bacterium]
MPPYGAKADGVTDDTAAIQRALDQNIGGIVYLPKGRYKITDRLSWPTPQRDITLWGESMAETVLVLGDETAGYSDPAKPKAMIWTGVKPAQRFKNYIRNLTLDTGKDNPGAIGVQFIANNSGAIRDVIIRAGSAGGPIGLDLGYTDEQGPCLVRNVTVIGFDVGVSARTSVDSITIEGLHLERQRQYGLVNSGQVISIRSLTSRNSVTAIQNSGTALLTLIDSTLTGIDTGAAPAIVNSKPAALLVRNTTTPGYEHAIHNDSGSGESAAGPMVQEFTAYPVLSLFPSATRTLGLPIQEPPGVSWGDPADWVSVTAFGATPDDKSFDSTEAFQKAIDSGAATVFVPKGTFYIQSAVHLRGKLERIIGLGQRAEVRGAGKLHVDDGDPPGVTVEAIAGTGSGVVHNSSRTLVLRDMALQALGGSGIYENTGGGDLFLEDVVGQRWRFANGQHVWARQLNTEAADTRIVNDGGTLWILGLKCERGSTLIHTKNGGRTELLGGFVYTTTIPGETPMFVTEDSSVSLTIRETSFRNPPAPFNPVVLERRGDEVRQLRKETTPTVTGGSLLNLYVGAPD